MAVWITGAAGFIGRHLVRHLASGGAQVAGLDLAECPAPLSGHISAWQTGALAPAQFASLARRTGIPETVYHLAGGSSVGASIEAPYRDFASTVDGTAALLDWVRVSAAGSRIVIVSSAAVYGDLHAGPISEDAAIAPFSPYGAHKYAMETICRGWAGCFGLNIATARLFSVYGPGLAKQLLWDLCCKLNAGTPQVVLGGTGTELRDWTHISDVVRALAYAVRFASPEVPTINAGTGAGSSVAQVAELVVRALGRDPACLEFSGQSRPGDPFSLVAAPGKLEAAGFAWRMGLQEGVAGYLDWFKSQDRGS